jgi:hypothetical protein
MKPILLFFLLPIMTILEIAKRLLGLFVYPVAYYYRDEARKRNERKEFSFLYYFLDDSIVADSMRRVDKPLEYCVKVLLPVPLIYALDKAEPLGQLFKWDWWRAYNFCALRNSAINLRDALSVGPMIAFKHYGSARNYYEVREFKNWTLPYLELWVGKFRLQSGILKSGVWQTQFRKYP